MKQQPKSSLESPARQGNSQQRRRLFEWLFTRLGLRVKEACTSCGKPFLVDRPLYDPDRYSQCPECRSRPDRAPNAARFCDCGQPAALVVYLAIYHPESAHPSYEPTPLCDICAIDELLARIEGKV